MAINYTAFSFLFPSLLPLAQAHPPVLNNLNHAPTTRAKRAFPLSHLSKSRFQAGLMIIFPFPLLTSSLLLKIIQPTL